MKSKQLFIRMEVVSQAASLHLCVPALEVQLLSPDALGWTCGPGEMSSLHKTGFISACDRTKLIVCQILGLYHLFCVRIDNVK